MDLRARFELSGSGLMRVHVQAEYRRADWEWDVGGVIDIVSVIAGAERRTSPTSVTKIS